MPRPLDIIVPVYRNPVLTRTCIESLLANLAEIHDRRPRLILVDDSPDDAETSAVLEQLAVGRGEHVVLMANERNLGFVQTVNRGLQLAQREGHDVLLVNSDTVTFPGTLSALLQATDADEQIAFASPRSNNASLCSLPHFHGGRPALPEEAHQRWKLLSATMPEWHFVPTAVGFYMYIAHRVLVNHGQLRTDFGLGYEEENDLVMRAGKVGNRAILVNHAFAFHAGSASFSLTDLDLGQHRHANHLKMVAEHPEFLPLVRRYQASAHFRAERLMAGLLPGAKGRLRVCFDLTGMGQHHNGTNEHIVAALKALAPRWQDRIAFTGIATQGSFEFHRLDQIAGLHRVDPDDAGVYGVGIRLSQPFDLHHVNVLDSLAPINVYAMLDTIAEDCGPLARDGAFIELWDFVAEHANGFLYNSRFSERAFIRRHRAAAGRPGFAMLLSTRVDEYRLEAAETDAPGHILVLGNHFPHKASDAAGRRLAAAFPSLSVVALGSENLKADNLQLIRPGTLSNSRMKELYATATVVVLPSHLEGFGLGLMHALAAGKPVAARNIPVVREVLACLDGVEGLELFDADTDMVGAVQRALAAGCSHVAASRGPGWNDWADGVAQLCLSLAASPDVFERLVRRIHVGDLLRQARAYREGLAQAQATPTPPPIAPAQGVAVPGAPSLSDLLALDGKQFVESAYKALLLREADEIGLAFYTAEIESGLSKLGVLDALSNSSEGCARAVSLDGLAEALDAANRGTA